jgi:tape measure domain-containing protein
VADNRAVKFDFLAGRNTVGREMRKVAGESDSLGGKLRKFGGFASKAMLGATVAVGGFAAAGVTMGLKTAASMQQAEIGFTTLLKSAKKSKKFVGDLKKFAAKTPFEFPGLVDASRMLLGVGVASKKVIPMLTDFGDAAGALAIDQAGFNRIMMATSQAISAGKFQAGDLNQIMNNGLPVWTLLSKAMHKSVPELRDLASHGKLLAKDVLPALQAQMHKDYGGAMAKQSQTLTGLWSTLMDTMNQGLADVIQPMIPWLQVALPKAIEILGTSLSGIGGVFRSAFGKLSEIAPKIDFKAVKQAIRDDAKKWAAPLIAGVKTGIESGNWKPLGAAVGRKISDSITGLASLMDKVVDAIKKWAAGVDWLNVGKAVGSTAVPFVIGFVSTMFDPLMEGSFWKKHWLDVVLFAVAFIPFGKAGSLVARLAKKFGFEKGISGAIIRGLEGSVGKVGRAVLDLVKYVGRKFAEGFKSAFPTVAGKVRSLVDGIRLRIWYGAEALAKAADHAVGGFVSGIGRALGRAVAAAGRAAWAVLKGLTWPFRTAGRFVAEPMMAVLKIMGGELLRGSRAALGWGIRILRSLVSGLWSGVKGVATPIWSGVRSILGAVGSLATSVRTKAWGFIRSLTGVIRSGVKNFGGLLWNAGANLISGLIGGIDSMFDSLRTKLSGVGAFIRAHKGPPAKDAVMLRPAGKLIMRGLIDGIEAGKADLGRSLGQIGTDYLSGSIAAGSSSTAAAGGGDTYIIQAGTVVPERDLMRLLDRLNARGVRAGTRVPVTA